ncbi:MAG: CDP-diacylglycerol--glycerol-3-phosphate 3-phosphatidyltransferase [Paracoccaceae bacterium]
MWTLPNFLTIGRIAAAPVVALAALAPAGSAWAWLAFALFALAALTDYADGWLARRLDQKSALGVMLDPIADKVMVIVVLASLMGAVGEGGGRLLVMLPALAIVLRELLVSGLREYLGDVKLPVTSLAKWKTAAQLTAVGALLFAHAVPSLAPLGGVALAVLWVAAALTGWTGLDYFRQAGPHLSAREGG